MTNTTIDLTINSDKSKSTTPIMEGKIDLYTDYEDKTEDVKKQFVVLKENQYIGSLKNVYSASNEFMTCDCQEERENGINIACGPDSDCINRLTNIECVNGQCGCGDNCLNQRFQRREYANFSIFLTENKGYGVKANVDIPAHTFIIEYIGDVVDAEEYKTRRQKYESEDIKHFYFMLIQDNEIIDATKRASLARYCNHSCDPNAYIEKWVVNKRFRMGIFAKRNIVKGEEICFDYNVDRYGAEPQKCYCGAANCRGVMGGKTQSETVRLLPRIIAEALGVRASTEKKWLKLQKQNGNNVTSDNADSNINAEFVRSLQLEPIDLSDVAKISSCLMQPDLDLIVVSRILERFTVLADDESLETLIIRFNRLHGIRAMGNTLKILISDIGNNKKLTIEQKKVLELVISLFETWPSLKSKNSIQDNEVEDSFSKLQLKSISSDHNKRINMLLEKWSNLEVVYRIPKNVGNSPSQVTILDDRRNRSNNNNILPSTSVPPTAKLPSGPASLSKQPWKFVNTKKLPANQIIDGIPLPYGWEWALDPSSGQVYYYNRILNTAQWNRPEWTNNGEEENPRKRKDREREKELRELKRLERERAKIKRTELKQEEEKLNMLSTIIAQASRTDTHDNALDSTHYKNGQSRENGYKKGQPIRSNNSSVFVNSKDKKQLHHHSENPHSSSLKEHTTSNGVQAIGKQWTALFATYVPNILKKYEAEIGRDNLKNCARDIVHLLTKKEEKRHIGGSVPSSLSERKAKIKTFSKDYMTKFLLKFEEKHKRKHHESHSGIKKQKV